MLKLVDNIPSKTRESKYKEAINSLLNNPGVPMEFDTEFETAKKAGARAAQLRKQFGSLGVNFYARGNKVFAKYEPKATE